MSNELDRWNPSNRYRKRMTEAARDLRKRATIGEGRLWRSLRDRRLDGIKFRRQEDLGPFVVDFFAPSLRLVIEIDGTAHDAPEQAIRDRERQAILETLGLHVLRVRAEKIEADLAGVVDQIRAAIRSAPDHFDRFGGEKT